MQYTNASLEIKMVDMSRRLISGYAAVHHSIDRVQDIIDPSASVKAVKRLSAPADVGVFIGHDATRLPVGIPQVIEPTSHGLYTETYILQGHEGDNLLAVAKDLQAHGIPLGMSIGYRTHDSRREIAGRKQVRRIMDYALKEYSYAAHQTIAHPEALVTAIKQRKALSEGTESAGGALVPPDEKGGGMQFRVEQRGEQWVVLCDMDSDADMVDDAEPIGSYASQGMADAVAAALRKVAGMMDSDMDEEDMGGGKQIPLTDERKAEWDTAYVNDLPNGSFLYVEPGEDDGEGKRVPRTKRHFPYKDAEGKVDLAHLRNAIARIPQSNAPGLDESKKVQLQARARRMLEHADDGKTYDEPEEWKTGAAIGIAGLAYRLLDIAERVVDEQKAMKLLGEDIKQFARMRQPLRDDLTLVGHDLRRLVEWSATVDRGEDDLATVQRYRAMVNTLDI